MELNYILEIHFKSGLTFPMPPADLDKALYAAGSVITTECVKSISIRPLAPDRPHQTETGGGD